MEHFFHFDAIDFLTKIDFQLLLNSTHVWNQSMLNNLSFGMKVGDGMDGVDGVDGVNGVDGVDGVDG